MANNSKQRIKSWVGFVLIVIIVLVVVGFLFGNIQYYETWSAPGESRGYIGRGSFILDKPHEMEEVFSELEEKFNHQEIDLIMFNADNNEVMAVLKNPDNPSEADYYYFEGTYLFRRGWHKGQPYRLDLFNPDSFKLSDINPSGFTHFHKKIQDYLKENNIVERKNSTYTINVEKGEDFLYLKADFNAEREDIRFVADIDGNHVQVIDKFSELSSFFDELAPEHWDDAVSDLSEEALEDLQIWMDKYDIQTIEEIQELLEDNN